ncbi:MAG: hypothetical protein DHS80DRAFT_16955, partial [Piptocephalis tieghemiana]
LQDMTCTFGIYYGSQTGNAEHIASTILRDSLAQGYNTHCDNLKDYAKTEFAHEKLLIIVVSTTGDGDPPDDILKFWRWIRKIKEKDALAHARYAILGLGDTNYDNFCNTARRLERRLSSLGAKPFHPTGLADDATGLEEVVDPWIEALWSSLEKALSDEEQSTRKVEITTLHDSPSTIKVNDKDSDPLSSDMGEPSAGQEEKEAPAVGRQKASLSPDQTGESPVESSIPIHITADTLASVTELTGIPKAPPVRCSIHYLLTDSEETCKMPQEEKELASEELHYQHCLPPGVQAPFMAKLQKATCLTTEDAVKRTLHLELSSSLDTLPGDAIGLLVPSPTPLVKSLADRLDLPLHQVLRVEGPPSPGTSPDPPKVNLPPHLSALDGKSTTLDHLLRWSLDITTTAALRKPLLRVLAEGAKEDEERKMLLLLCSKQGSSIFSQWRDQCITLLDLLDTFPSVQCDLGRLLDVLPALQPRSYSVTSSPLLTPGQLDIAFNVVRYVDPRGHTRKGLCTPWLDAHSKYPPSAPSTHPSDLTLGKEIPIFQRPTTTFRLPEDLSRPIIMIGPGTGVAPFIGFIQHRAAQRSLRWKMSGSEGLRAFGPTWLLYGCRDERKDFLYREALEKAQEDGSLHRLDVAQSRREEGVASYKYVGDILIQEGSRLWDWMENQGAYLYVCGDAKAMAKSVDEALRTVISKETGKEPKEVLGVIKEWSTKGRYLRDLVSHEMMV